MKFQLQIFMAVFFLALATWAQSKAVALLSEVQGTLHCGSSSMSLFDTCYPGQTFQAAPGSRWTLSFVQAGRRISGGEGRYRIEETGVIAEAGSATTRQTSAPQLQGITLDRSLNWDRMGGVHRDDLEWTMDGACEQEQVALRWKAADPYERVEIVVEKLPDYERVLKREMPARPAECSVQLQAGQKYLLSLRGFSRSTWQPQAQVCNLAVLAPSEVQRIRMLEKEATPVELCFQYAQLGLNSRARQLAASLLKQYPEQETLRALARP